jgi:hypothetical protein
VKTSGIAANLATTAQMLPSRAFCSYVDITLGSVKNISPPLTVTQDVSSSGATTGETVAVFSFDEGAGTWTHLQDAVVNASGIISYQVGHLSVYAAFNTFTLADLAGVWRFSILQAGTGAGWARGTVSVDAAGSATVTSYLDSSGSTTPPAGTTLTISPQGIVGSTDSSFNGTMSANKILMVATQTATNGGSQIQIFQKQVSGVTFSSADLTGPMSFSYHTLFAGAESTWERGSGTINSSGQMTLTSLIEPTGPSTPDAANIPLTISADGVITVPSAPGSPSFDGFMSADKKLIVAPHTSPDNAGAYEMLIIQIGGATYSSSDFIGSGIVHTLVSADTASKWSYGTLSRNSTGLTSYTAFLDKNGTTTLPASFPISVGSSGTITSSANSSLHGTMSADKQMVVTTLTDGNGLYNLAVIIR